MRSAIVKFHNYLKSTDYTRKQFLIYNLSSARIIKMSEFEEHQLSSPSDADDKPIQPKHTSFAWGNLMKKGRSCEDEKSVSSKKMKYSNEFGNKKQDQTTGELTDIMSHFGTDVQKIMDIKRKKLDVATGEVLNNYQEKLEKVLKIQLDAQCKEYKKLAQNTSEVITQSEKNLKSIKEQEEKTIKLFEQHMLTTKLLIQQEAKRIETLKNMHSSFSKVLKETELKQKEEIKVLGSELKAEMDAVHKKISKENAQQALANARKSFLSGF
ncbi:hypothetical protein B566_EDAN002972 [Ephemera danica]|nr:hypothetical protein B566_EDAN002972 [Ephemera danica]